MKFLWSTFALPGILIVSWIASGIICCLLGLVSSELGKWILLSATILGFGFYCFRTLDLSQIWAQRFVKTLGILAVLPLVGYWTLRLIFAVVVATSSTHFSRPGQQGIELITCCVGLIFCLLLLNLRKLFFVRPFWRSGLAIGFFMLCSGFLCEDSINTEFKGRKADSILQFARGKSTSAIIKLLGLPTSKEFGTFSHEFDEVWIYDTRNGGIVLAFRKGVCDYASKIHTFH